MVPPLATNTLNRLNTRATEHRLELTRYGPKNKQKGRSERVLTSASQRWTVCH